MTKSDVLSILGLASFGSGLYFIYHPLPLLFAGAMFLVVARGASRKPEAKR